MTFGILDFRFLIGKLDKNERTVFLMTTEKCKKLIQKDMMGVTGQGGALLLEIDEIDLNEIDRQLDLIMRDLENAKSLLKGCEDY